MDMSPPLPPPAIERAHHQDAIDAAMRLGSVSDWQRAQQPYLPDGMRAIESPSRQAVLDDIDTFWNTPAEEAPPSRRIAFADRIAWVVRDIAMLGESDGTLSPEAVSLARRASATRGNAIPDGLQCAELMVGDEAYAGALVVSDHHRPGTVLLFTPDGGLDSFPDLASLTTHVESRIRQTLLHNADIDGVTRQAFAPRLDSSFVDTRPIVGDAFDHLVERIVDNQKSKLREAWRDRHATDGNDRRDQAFVDHVDRVMHLGTSLDADAILAVRDARLVQSVMEARLTDLPDDVRKDWVLAQEGLIETVQNTADDAAELPSSEVDDLPAFASERLREQLTMRGVTADPKDIVVALDRSADPIARVESLKTLFEGPAPARIRLIDLAYQNVAAIDFARLSALDSQGNLIAALPDEAIRTIVRSVNLGETYKRSLDEDYRSGPWAARRRELSTRVQRSRMRLQANEARLSYFNVSSRGALRFDQNQRGFRWIEAILDHPSPEDRAKVEKHDIVVRHVTYRGVALGDVLEIGVRSSESTPTIILYTPGAPDGIVFREFDDRQQAARQFFYHPAFREYLLDRLPASFARLTPNGITRQFDTDGRSWVFGGSSHDGYTQTGEPFQYKDITGNFLDASYDASIALGFRNAQTFLRSADDANWNWLLHRNSELVGNNLLINSIKGMFMAPMHAAGASWRFYDSVKAGDGSQAFIDFAELYTHALGLLPYYAVGRSTGIRYVRPLSSLPQTGIRFRSGTSLTTPVRSPRIPVEFDRSYLAKDVVAPASTDSHGLLTVAGRQYIRHNGQLYGARYDATFETVRLQRPTSGPFSIGPAIRRQADGLWVRNKVGLMGGSGRPGRSRSSPPAGQAEMTARQQPFTPEENAVFKARMDHELAIRVPNTVVRTDLLRQVEDSLLLSRAPNLPAEQAQAWSQATEAAFDAVVRHRQRLLAYPAPIQPGPLDLSVAQEAVAPVAPTSSAIPQGYRLISAADVPVNLYLYAETPFYSSTFRRPRANRPGMVYANDRATVTPSVLGPGLIGVRLTVMSPTAPISVLRSHSGLYLRKSLGFGVRLDARGIVQRYTQGPRSTLQLLEIEGTDGMQFVLRTTTGTNIDLFGADFYEPIVGLARMNLYPAP